MKTYQFVDLSKDLYTQVHVIENLVKSSVFKEANTRLSAARKICDNLETLVEPENELQRRIVTNRKLEIHWLDTAIQVALAKNPKKAPAKKRAAKKA
jgi:hypothetical protein